MVLASFIGSPVWERKIGGKGGPWDITVRYSLRLQLVFTETTRAWLLYLPLLCRLMVELLMTQLCVDVLVYDLQLP